MFVEKDLPSETLCCAQEVPGKNEWGGTAMHFSSQEDRVLLSPLRLSLWGDLKARRDHHGPHQV